MSIKAMAPPHTPAAPSLELSLGLWPAFKALLHGLVAGWLIRWAAFAVLAAGTSLYDLGAPGRSSRSWIDVLAVWCGIAGMAVAMWNVMRTKITAAAARRGLSCASWVSKAPITSVVLPLALWAVAAGCLLLWHANEWGVQQAVEERHADMVGKAGSWQLSGHTVPPDPRAVLATYQQVLDENSQHRAALQEREQLINRLLEHARQLYLSRQLSEANQVFQALLAPGISADWVQGQRSSLYQCGSMTVGREWTPGLRIGNGFLELVADGPVEISGGDPAAGGVLISDPGTHDLQIETKSLCFRSPHGTRRVDYYLANERVPGEDAARPQGIRDPLQLIAGALRNRDAPAKLTINGAGLHNH